MYTILVDYKAVGDRRVVTIDVLVNTKRDTRREIE
jgi:hypothetical protein